MLFAKSCLQGSVQDEFAKAICRNVIAEYFCKFTYYLVIISTFSQI